MKRAAVLEGVRMMRFWDVFGRREAGELSQMEAAELLGIAERTFRRWSARYEDEGEAGLRDRRHGKASPKLVPAAEAEAVARLYRERYQGFTAKHFHEHLVRDHNFRWGYTWTKVFLQKRKLLEAAPRRGAHRRKRERRPLLGMMLHQDGSTHRWLPGLHRDLDLIVTMDDATGDIYSAFLIDQEGTWSSFRGLADVLAMKGLPCSIYTDRGAHYFVTPVADGPIDRDAPTQFGRAMSQLGIEHIGAYSPQARGRSERVFRTLQDRLIKELALAGINDVDAANRFIAEIFLPDYNRRFAVAPAVPGSAFVPVRSLQWREVMCVQVERVVANDNTVSYKTLHLQIPKCAGRPHFVKAKVHVHHYEDDTLAIFHGPRCLARFAADGKPIQENMNWAA
jgi:transposase